MRHRVAGRQLNRTSAHRLAMRRNMVASLFEHETISTTIEKAKEVKPFAEKLITLAKKGTLAARRRSIAMMGNRDIVGSKNDEPVRKGTVVGKLFSELGPRYLDRPGGYTRIIRLSKTRLGDNGSIVLLQLVGADETVKKEHRKAKPEKIGSKKGKKAVPAEETAQIQETGEAPQSAREKEAAEGQVTSEDKGQTGPAPEQQ